MCCWCRSPIRSAGRLPDEQSHEVLAKEIEDALAIRVESNCSLTLRESSEDLLASRPV
jgi:hypothetical protein